MSRCQSLFATWSTWAHVRRVLTSKALEDNARLAAEQATAAPGLSDDALARLRALLKPRQLERPPGQTDAALCDDAL